MEKKLLFKLNVWEITVRNRSYRETNFQKMLKLMNTLLCPRCKRVGYIEIYTTGFQRFVYPPKEQYTICFGKAIDYASALKKAKSNKKILVPTDFLYDKKRYENQSFIYSAKFKEIMLDNNAAAPSFCLDEAWLDMAVQPFFAYFSPNTDCLSLLSEHEWLNFAWFEDCQFSLGHSVFCAEASRNFDFSDVLKEFILNTEKYSFIKVSKLKYRLDISTFPKEDCCFIFKKEYYLSSKDALILFPNNPKLKELVANGEQDFYYDKNNNTIFPAPKNSVFIETDAILKKWNLGKNKRI